MPATNKVWNYAENGKRFSENCKPTQGMLDRLAAREFATRDRTDEFLAKVHKYILAGDANKAGLWAADLVSLLSSR